MMRHSNGQIDWLEVAEFAWFVWAALVILAVVVVVIVVTIGWPWLIVAAVTLFCLGCVIYPV